MVENFPDQQLLHQLGERIESLRNQNDALSVVNDELQDENNQLKLIKEDSEKKIDSLEKRIDRIQAMNRKLEQNKSDFRKQIDALKKENAAPKQQKDLQSSNQSIVRSSVHLPSTSSNVDNNIPKFRTNLKKLEKTDVIQKLTQTHIQLHTHVHARAHEIEEESTHGSSQHDEDQNMDRRINLHMELFKCALAAIFN